MKLKSLIIGSVAAAGLSTAGFAADLGVLTSLDVCDELGLSGLTISSDTNCLQISGGVAYEFRFGDYRSADVIAQTPFGNNGGGLSFGAPDIPGPDADPVTGESADWHSKVEAWLKFVGTASSDFGAAKAVIKIKQVEAYRAQNESYAGAGNGASWGDNDPLEIDEAYVSIGDSTVIMAGKKSSIANFGDSEPFNFLKTFGWSAVDNGVGIDSDDTPDVLGGHVIQVVSDLGNGFSVGLGLENLDGENGTNAASAGSVVGVVGYAGETITAHLTGIAVGVLDGDVDLWAAHGGVTATFDAFKVRAAAGYIRNDLLDVTDLHALVSGQASFDMFTLALSGEYMRSEVAGVVADGFGIGGSIGATVTEGVSINLGARYFSAENAPLGGVDNDAVQVAAQLVAAVTETIKITGEIGAYFNDVTLPASGAEDTVYYGSASLAWAPGGGFTSSLAADIYSNDAYRVTFKAAKSFE
jgi:hypothetical protein